MKTKLLLLISLFTWTFIASADNKSTTTTREVEITVSDDGENATKKIIVNGKELSPEEMEEFEDTSKIKSIQVINGDHSSSAHKVVMINSGETENSDVESQVRIIKKHSSGMDEEDIQLFIDKDGGVTTEKIIVNGKELSAEEIEEFKASGKMKVINIDSDTMMVDGNKRIFINSDSEHGDDIDIDVIMDKIGELDNIDASKIQDWISGDGKKIKVISNSRSVFIKDDNSASLGFMANVEDDGWHLTKIMDKSGAKDVGILVGDIVKKIGNVDMIKNSDNKIREFNKVPKFKEGEIVEVVVERAGQTITFDVQARLLDKSAMTIDLKSNGGNHFEWVEKLHKNGDIASNIKVMVFDGKDGEFKLNEDDIHMVFPEKLGKMKFFVSDGKSTSKLLGKNHEMSSLSDGLGKYFGTKGGVLVLHVDASNAFSLKDGDVIKSINNNEVDSPKDVVKQLINADEQENIQIEVIRNKRNKTLKYEK